MRAPRRAPRGEVWSAVAAIAAFGAPRLRSGSSGKALAGVLRDAITWAIVYPVKTLDPGLVVRRRWQQLHGVPGVRRHASLSGTTCKLQPEGRELVEAPGRARPSTSTRFARTSSFWDGNPGHSGGRGVLDQPGTGQEARVSARVVRRCLGSIKKGGRLAEPPGHDDPSNGPTRSPSGCRLTPIGQIVEKSLR